jgi:HTH-type transcriptional regulator/antitoxin HigA
MNTYIQSGDLPELTEAWSAFQRYAPLRPIRNEEDFQRLHELADVLADAVGDEVNHPLYSLFDLTMTLIEQWEKEHVSIPAAAPREVLRHLLEVNNLKQKDLEDIASPTLVSDILSGRREISRRLAKTLAERFNVNIGAFI